MNQADGTKFGKSEKGNIWLDAEKTSPYEFYQFWLNQSDEDSERFIKLFTLISKEEIESMIEEHRKSPEKRLLQNELAKYMTCMVHSEEAYQKAVKASSIFFGKSTIDDLKSIDEQTLLSVLKDVPKVSIEKELFNGGINVINLFSDYVNFGSKTELRKIAKSNGISVNKVKVGDKDTVKSEDLICGKYLVVNKGKKYALVMSK